MQQPKVKIQYGIFGGERLGKKLQQALRDAGYTITKDAAQADIIFAYSAGCFWLPEAPSKQKLLLVDPPYWPGKSLSARTKARIKSNRHFRPHGYTFRRWLLRQAWGTYYAVAAPRHNRRIRQFAPHYDLPTAIQGHDVIIVRNEHDDWLTPDLDELQRANPKLIIKHLPGDHEDWYHHPQQYVDLLQLFYKERRP